LWKTCFSKKHDQKYYHNTITDETTWEKPERKNDIKECYNDYIKKESSNTTRILHDFSTNKYLFIELNRFESDNSNIKIFENIEPNKELILPSFNKNTLKEENSVKYSLIGVIIHLGETVGDSHYVYYSYKDQLYYNDDTIGPKNPTDLSDNEKIENNGYIFLYKKIDGKSDGRKKSLRNKRKSLRNKRKSLRNKRKSLRSKKILI